MKVYCINFQSVINGKSGNALVQYLYEAFRQLDDSKKMIVPCSKGSSETKIISHSNFSFFIYRSISFLLIKFRVPYYITRTLLESYVDFLHYCTLRKETKPYVLITTMYSVFSTSFAKKHGNKVILLAGNLNDNLYFDVVNSEQKRLGLHYTDVFCSKYRIRRYRKMLDNLDEVWCNSSLSQRSFSNFKTKLLPITFYYPRGYTQKVYNAKTINCLTLGYIGHTTLLKGVQIVAEAIYKSKNKESIVFKIVGSVDGRIRRIIDKFNIKVEYLGRIPESDKEKVLKSFDYLCVPSLYDAGPTTIYEGVECNVPLIVSDGCGGCDFIKNNNHCFIFKSGDSEDLREKIDYIFKNKESLLTNGLDMDGINRQSNDNIKTIIEEIEKL